MYDLFSLGTLITGLNPSKQEKIMLTLMREFKICVKHKLQKGFEKFHL